MATTPTRPSAPVGPVIMVDMIEAVVAPGRTVYAGPPNAAGTATRAYQPGETVIVTREDAVLLRSIGHLLQADGSAFSPVTIGPMPAGYDKATR